MSATGLDVFDSTVQKTNLWLNELLQIAGWEDRRTAYRAQRDRLTVDEVAQLAAQLPMLIRSLYYEGWDPSIQPLNVGGH